MIALYNCKGLPLFIIKTSFEHFRFSSIPPNIYIPSTNILVALKRPGSEYTLNKENLK